MIQAIIDFLTSGPVVAILIAAALAILDAFAAAVAGNHPLLARLLMALANLLRSQKLPPPSLKMFFAVGMLCLFASAASAVDAKAPPKPVTPRVEHISPDGTVNELYTDNVYRPVPGAVKRKPVAGKNSCPCLYCGCSGGALCACGNSCKCPNCPTQEHYPPRPSINPFTAQPRYLPPAILGGAYCPPGSVR